MSCAMELCRTNSRAVCRPAPAMISRPWPQLLFSRLRRLLLPFWTLGAVVLTVLVLIFWHTLASAARGVHAPASPLKSGVSAPRAAFAADSRARRSNPAMAPSLCLSPSIQKNLKVARSPMYLIPCRRAERSTPGAGGRSGSALDA